MIKQSDQDPEELSPGLAKAVAPEYTAAFDRWRDLTARFGLLNNSELGRSLKRMEGLSSSLLQSLKLSSPLIESFKQLEGLKLPSVQALKQFERLTAPFTHMQTRISAPFMQTMARFESPLRKQMWAGFDSPAFAAIQAARLWSDSLSESHRSAQSSLQETLKIFQRAAEEAAAMARVDVGELATAVDASLGSLPLPDAAQLPASAPASGNLQDAWKALPFSVQLFLFLLWYLLLIPLAADYVQQWIKASPESRPEIIVNVNQNLGKDFSSGLRCVRGAGVNIRESPSKTAPIIGRLSRSQSVAILETKRGFSKIQYQDAASREIREGWVASGYLIGAAC